LTQSCHAAPMYASYRESGAWNEPTTPRKVRRQP
jgi:hypothetical protein